MKPVYLHLGSGAKPRFFDDGITIHLDISPDAPHVELVCDLNYGIPLPSNTIHTIVAANILEHLDDVVAIMNEMHRVLVPDGIAWIQVPLWGSPNHTTDPTHKHGFNELSFDFFDDTTELGSYNGKLYTPQRWQIIKKSPETGDVLVQMRALKPTSSPAVLWSDLLPVFNVQRIDDAATLTEVIRLLDEAAQQDDWSDTLEAIARVCRTWRNSR